VLVFDITSLYPTMIINNNISPETVNCSCCKDDPKARLTFDYEFVKDFLYNKNSSCYWVCRRRLGLFSNKLKELTQIRIQYKKEGKILESTAIKAIINSGYGVFGHSNFKYYDPSVAELVTALGRQTLLRMQEIGKGLNFKILYGDTDSLFVNGVNSKDDILDFKNICKNKLNVDVVHEKYFQKLILVSSKHYLGFTSDKNQDPVIKGMEGIKSDRPEFIQTTFREMVKDIQEDINPIPKLKQALTYLDKRQVPKDRLEISLTLTKDPQDYMNECLQKRLGTELRLKKGDTLVYYKCDQQLVVYDHSGKQRTRIIGESVDPNDVSYAKYKERLIKSVKDVIEILGYSVEKDLLAKRKLS
jgi:DNA polymerase elongation subunit (family B)